MKEGRKRVKPPGRQKAPLSFIKLSFQIYNGNQNIKFCGKENSWNSLVLSVFCMWFFLFHMGSFVSLVIILGHFVVVVMVSAIS